MSLNAGGDWMIHTERANRPRAQCVADARRIFHKYRRSILLGGAAFVAGALLCLLLTPEDRVMETDGGLTEEVASWASSRRRASVSIWPRASAPRMERLKAFNSTRRPDRLT